MAKFKEHCVGELTGMSNGRQLGDQCSRRAYNFQNHLCYQHQSQHNNPSYPTRNSYRRRSDERPVPNHTSRTEVRPNMSQAEASTSQRPVDNPSRATAKAKPSQPNPLHRELTSSSPQSQTPPEQPDRRKYATPEPPGRLPLHTHAPTQASNAVSAPSRSLRSHNLPTPPATEKTASPALNGILRQSKEDQSSTLKPNSSHSLSPPQHNHTPRAASSNSKSPDSVNDQSEDEVSPRTYLSKSSNSPRHPSLTGSSSTVSNNISYYNGLTQNCSTPSLSPTSHHRSSLREATVHLYTLLYRLQSAGECPNAEPLGLDYIERTSVPGDCSVIDIILNILQGYMELRSIDKLPEGVAVKLLKVGCKESEDGQRFRGGLRVWMRKGETVNEEAVAAFALEDGFEEGEGEEGRRT